MALEDRKRLPALEEGELKRGISHDLTSSPKLDRYKLAKQLTEKAIKEKKIFSICGHYPVVRAALQRRGWVEKKLQFLPKAAASAEDGGDGPAESKRAEGKKAQEEALGKSEDIRKVMARLVRNEMPYFLWTIRRDIIDCHSLHCEQMLNHYGKTASFTTKIGLCLNLRSLPWCTQADPDTFFPRCYSLCTASDKQAFLDDFRLTMACSILKWVVSHQNCGGSTARNGREEAAGRDPHRKTGPENADSELTGFPEQLVDMACRVCQDALGQLEHEDVGVPEDTAKLLTEDEWEDLTQHYYSLVRGDAYISNSRNHFSRCQALLHKISSVNPQTEIDGLQNIWIVKPAAKSRGRDIVCMNRVEEILELEAPGHLSARDKWVVQKYIETPLLIYDTKFDIRQWFLVTDWNPLTIWFYKESYLRFSTQRFSLDSLDSAIHLCNNSIQRHLKNDAGRSPLLPQYNMWTSSQFREYLQQRGQGSAWSGIIYPSMKQAVADTVHVAQGRVEPRRNSFELYGADFVLGRDFRPWLIEINSSPTMHASTPVTAQLCAQVQEDVIRVVVGRRDGRCCDVGNFELLWRQPTVGLPPSCGSELRVEGVGMRKANKQMLPVSSFNFPSSLSDMQPPKGRCSLAAPGLAPGPPQMAPQQDLKLRNAKVLMCSLPRPLKRPVARGCQVQSTHAETDGDLELPAGDVQPADNKPSKAGLPKGGSDGHVEPNELKEHPQPSMLPSAATVEGALPRPPRPSATALQNSPLASLSGTYFFNEHFFLVSSGLPGDVPTPPCPVCCSSLPPSRPCKRCRSFCAAILQGASFVPLDGPSGPRIPGRRGPGPDQRAQPASAACVSGSYT